MDLKRRLVLGLLLFGPWFAGPALADSPGERATNPFLAILMTLAPLVLVLGLLYWYMKRVGVDLNKEHVQRSLVHMERVEKQNAEVLEALKRIESALRER